jgi:hypothetical protein
VIAAVKDGQHVLSFVMPGFMPGIHVFRISIRKDVDGRNKSGHDVEEPSEK